MNIKTTRQILLGIAMLCLVIPSFSSAHPGRTDASGGHTCRTNCAKWGLSEGEYHYHQSKGVPQATAPIRSHADGTTEVWPEYAYPVTTTTNTTTNTTTSVQPTAVQVAAAKPINTCDIIVTKKCSKEYIVAMQSVLHDTVDTTIVVDGKWGTKTTRALHAYQKARNLTQSSSFVVSK